MPVHPVVRNGRIVGYMYGHPGHGHVIFKNKIKANKQAEAIRISQSKTKKYIREGKKVYKRRKIKV